MKNRSAALCALLVAGAAACGPGDNNGTNNDTNNGTTNNGTPSCDDPQVLTNEDVNGTVTLEAGCYTTESELTVTDGLLTLEPGVLIEFGADVGLSIQTNGSLSAVGTATDKIFLTGGVEERGHWQGLYFEGSDSPDNKLDHVTLQYAGGKNWHGGEISRGGIYLRGGGNRLSITNTTFLENGQAGLVADEGSDALSIADTHFENNEWPLWVHANLVGSLASTLTFEGNDNSFIVTAITGATAEPISDDQTWEAFDIPYRTRTHLGVLAHVTLSPGVTIVFEQDLGIDIGGEGRLTAAGTAEAPITFTGAEAERGFWRGLYFHDTRSTDNILDHVVLEYGGGGQWHGGANSRGGVYMRAEGVALAVSNTTFRENEWAGILADNGAAEFSVESSTFEANERPLWLDGNLVGGIAADNVFTGNDENQVWIGAEFGSTSVVSTDQQWQTLGVPYRVGRNVDVIADLTLSAGTTIEFAQDTGMMVDGGTLTADATGGDRIVFTAADGETLNGFWKGIYFTTSFSTVNIIANADILYGGSSGWHGGEQSQAGLFLRGGNEKSSVELNDVKIANSGRYGISVEAEASVSPCTDVTLENNTEAPASIHADAIYACAP